MLIALLRMTGTTSSSIFMFGWWDDDCPYCFTCAEALLGQQGASRGGAKDALGQLCGTLRSMSRLQQLTVAITAARVMLLLAIT